MDPHETIPWQQRHTGHEIEMKPYASDPHRSARRDSGATLIECLVYIGVMTTILAVATSAFFRCHDHMRSLRRNADDMTRVLRTGELWRDDIRQAIVPPSLVEAEQTLRITHTNGIVEYRLDGDQLLRRADVAMPWSSVLTNLNVSQMRPLEQSGVVAWRWEIALRPLRKPARVEPLFTFTAVAGSNVAP